MRESWHQYYQEHRRVYLSNLLLHWPYLLRIIQLKPKNILEIGCGPADHSVFLSYLLPPTEISLLDKEAKIIDQLKKRLNGRIRSFYLGDITNRKEVDKQGFSQKQFDLIYSQGLMEHFDKKNFRKIIKNFLPYTQRFLFSIPSENYPVQEFGDEKLRNEKELNLILAPIRNISFKIRKYFPDIGLRTKMMTIKKKKMSLTQAIDFLIFGSCHYLIEITSLSAV